MGGNPVFRRLVHFKSPYLDLKGLSVGSDKRGVKGTVHILLRHGDIILKPSRNRLIHLVNHAKGRITVLHRVHNDADGKQIIDLVDGLVLVLHLLIDAEKVLDPPVDLSFDPCIFDMLAHLVHNALDIFFPDALSHRNLIHQIVISLGLQIFQGQIVQLHLDLGDSQPLGNGRIDLHGFPGNPLLPLLILIFQRAHIVEPVRQLDQYHADVLCHGEKHFPQILRLHLQPVRHIPVTRKFERFQLGDTVHQKGHVLPKLRLYLLLGHDGILHHVVKKSRRNGFLVHLQIRQNNGHIQRMDNIRLP